MIPAAAPEPEHRGPVALARPLFPAGVALAGTDPRAPQPAPWPEERAGLDRPRPERLREFAAGRAAARRAMAQLGHPPAPVPHGLDRAPVWPAGLSGTISHCRSACLAAVARADTARALGLDLEEDTPLPLDLIPAICTPEEAARLAQWPEDRRGRMAKVIFSAKECAYKAQFPLSRTLFGFQALDLLLEPEAGRFTARFVKDVAPFAAGTRLNGRFAIGDGLIVTAMVLARTDLRQV
ncbi:MAG: 4'-phosphopantetheinyl transferase [Pseudodonghicola sp.]